MMNSAWENKAAGYWIRLAEPRDLPLLNAIELAAATVFPVGALPEQVLSERLPLEVLRAGMQAESLWVALIPEEEPVGYLLLQVLDGIPLLAQVDVHPAHGRKGLGTALIARGVRYAREAGFPALYLTTFAHIPWNAPFYERLGFVALPKEEVPGVIAGILRDEQARGLDHRVAMRRSLREKDQP